MPYWPDEAALLEKPYVPEARENYLAECRHFPPCVDCWFCGLRRQLEQGVRDGVITQGQATRLVKKFLQEGRA